MEFDAPKIVLTTHQDPKTWWPDADPKQKEALHRRITRSIFYRTGVDPEAKSTVAEEPLSLVPEAFRSFIR